MIYWTLAALALNSVVLQVAAQSTDTIGSTTFSNGVIVDDTKSSRNYGRQTQDNPNGNFICPSMSYITRVNAWITDTINAVKFQCSDGTWSDCYGATCSDKTPPTWPGVYSGRDLWVLKSLSSEQGFESMSFLARDDGITGLKTVIEQTDLALEPDTQSKGGAYRDNYFPTADEKAGVGQKNASIIGFDTWYDQEQLRSIRVHYRSSTPLTLVPSGLIPLNAAAAVLSIDPQLTPQLTFYLFGGIGGNQFEFMCNPGTYITTLTSLVSDKLDNVEFTCSDDKKSGCFGASCQYQWSKPFYMNDARSDYHVLRTMSSSTGFNSMEMIVKGTVIGVKSANSIGNLVPNIPVGGIAQSSWQKWPDVADLKEGQSMQKNRIVGFKFRTGDKVDRLQPYFLQVVENETSDLSSTPAGAETPASHQLPEVILKPKVAADQAENPVAIPLPEVVLQRKDATDSADLAKASPANLPEVILKPKVATDQATTVKKLLPEVVLKEKVVTINSSVALPVPKAVQKPVGTTNQTEESDVGQNLAPVYVSHLTEADMQAYQPQSAVMSPPEKEAAPYVSVAKRQLSRLYKNQILMNNNYGVQSSNSRKDVLNDGQQTSVVNSAERVGGGFAVVSLVIYYILVV